MAIGRNADCQIVCHDLGLPQRDPHIPHIPYIWPNLAGAPVFLCSTSALPVQARIKPSAARALKPELVGAVSSRRQPVRNALRSPLSTV